MVYRDLGPEPPTQGPKITQEFTRNADPEQVRKEEIDVKANRITDVAKDIAEKHISDATDHLTDQPYTHEEIAVLEHLNLTIGGDTRRIVGSPKPSWDARRLAEHSAQNTVIPKRDERLEKICAAKDSMHESRKAPGNGIIAGTKRGGSTRRFDV